MAEIVATIIDIINDKTLTLCWNKNKLIKEKKKNFIVLSEISEQNSSVSTFFVMFLNSFMFGFDIW